MDAMEKGLELSNLQSLTPITTKRRKGMEISQLPNASKRRDGVDLISRMPDAILVLILSRLSSTEQAIRSSILSRRWRYLWTQIPSLSLHSFKQGGNFKKNKFKEFVYRVLVNASVDLDRLDLCCLDYYSMSTVGMWIHAAVMRNVKELYLKFCTKENEETQDIELPHSLVACFSLKVLSLDLGYCALRLLNVTGFRALRVLRLTFVDLGDQDDVVKDFFKSCPLLEDLSLIDCFICNLGRLCISCPKLKNLTVRNREDNEEDMCSGIKISCPKLVYFKLTGHIARKFFFECLDSLKEAEIAPKMLGNITSLFAAISHVECLSIDIYFFGQCINAARDPTLRKLKFLELITTMDASTMEEFNRILKYYPNLESLKVSIEQMYDRPEDWELHEGEARRSMTIDVTRVEFFKYQGEKPKLVSNWHNGNTLLEMVFSWGTKAKHFQYRL